MTPSFRIRVAIAAASACSATTRAELTWQRTTIERTLPPASDIAELVFACSNPGPKPVRILHVQPGCGCTTAALESEVVPSGGRSKLTLYFDPKGLIGLQEKTVQVFTDERPAATLLRLRITIPEPITIVPRLLLWTIGEENKAKEVLIRAASNARLKIVAVKSDHPALTATVTAEEDGRRYRLLVQPHSTDTAFHGCIRFEAQLDSTPGREIAVFTGVY